MKILKDFLMNRVEGDGTLPGPAAASLTDSAQPAADKKNTAPKPEPSSQDDKVVEEIKKLREDNAAQREQEAKNRRYEVSGQPDPNNPWVDVFKNLKALGNIAGDTAKELIDKATGGKPKSDLYSKIKNSFAEAQTDEEDKVNVGAQAGGRETKPDVEEDSEAAPPADPGHGGRPGM